MPGAIEAARRVGELDREKVRGHFEECFTAARMARDYVKLYERITSAEVRGEVNAA
jgi:hypothetical protein